MGVDGSSNRQTASLPHCAGSGNCCRLLLVVGSSRSQSILRKWLVISLTRLTLCARRKNGENYPQWLTIYPVEYNGNRLFAGVFMDVGELTAGNERLASLAYYDPLTELPNRSLFQEFLKARVSQRDPATNRFAVLYIDLDFFKSVNDLHGHDCGDRVPQQAELATGSTVPWKVSKVIISNAFPKP